MLLNDTLRMMSSRFLYSRRFPENEEVRVTKGEFRLRKFIQAAAVYNAGLHTAIEREGVHAW